MRFVHTQFREFEDYEAGVQDADVQFTLPARIDNRWSLSELYVDGYHLQIGSEGSGNIAKGAAHDGTLIVFFTLDGSRTIVNGEELGNRLSLISPGADFSISYKSSHDWASLAIPLHHETDRIRRARTNHVASNTLQSLRNFAARIDEMARAELSSNRSPNLQVEIVKFLDSIRNELVWKSAAEADINSDHSRSRSEVIDKAVSLIENSSTAFPSVHDVAQLSDVSERTLRTYFQQYFGVSPRKYIELRRLHLAKRILEQGEEHEFTVGQIAGHVGYWDFGRFASRYHKLFGEFPSVTLRRVRNREVSTFLE